VYFSFQTEEEIRMVKPLTFGDLRKSLATVAVDMATSKFFYKMLEMCEHIQFIGLKI